MAEHLHIIAFLENIGGPEWMMILIIGLLVFGRRLPEVARNLGKSVNEFKKGMREFQESANEVASDVTKAANDTLADTEEHTGTTAYEESSGSYENPTPSEPVSEDADMTPPAESEPSGVVQASSVEPQATETKSEHPETPAANEPMV